MSSSAPIALETRTGGCTPELRGSDDDLSARAQLQPEFQSLPPADGGKDAWLFLAACFMIEALVWGFPFAFGVFQDYYSTHEPFADSGNVVIIGTCAMGIMYLAAPITIAVLQSHPKLRRPASSLGLVIMCAALAGSSFATNTTHLIIAQGIFYAIGGSVCYSPTILFMDEWFIRRRGLAFGVMWAATGVAGVVLPLLMQWLLNAYGFQTTLRIWSVAMFVLTAPLLVFLKPRLPLSQSTATRRFSLEFLKARSFTIYQIGNIIEGLGYFLPSIYLPTYAKSLGASNVVSALTLMVVNIMSCLGCVLMGNLVDRFHVSTCILISTVGTVFGVFVLWGLATTLPRLMIFCAVFGLFAGSFSTTWAGITADVKRQINSADVSIVFGCLAAGRGIGNVVSGPLSEALLKTKTWDDAEYVYGTGYGSLIVFTGVTAMVPLSSFIGRRVGWL